MALPVWPPSLSIEVLRRAFTIAPATNLVASEGESGVGKVRRKGAPKPVVFTNTLRVSNITEMALFDTFWTSTLDEGALRFEHPHPITGVTVELMIIPMSQDHPYKWTPTGRKGWSTPLTFKIMP